MPKKRKKLSEFLQSYYDLINDYVDTEEWKPIELGDKTLYEISNHGRVRRYDNKYTINPFHSYRKDKDGNYIKDRPTYLRVQLYYYENGKRRKKHCEISRLVAIHFIPIPKKLLKKGYTQDTLQVNHIKGGYHIYNNFVTNLEWCTVEENIDHAFKEGLRHPARGDQYSNSFLTDEDVVKICECIQKGLNAKDTFNTITLSINDKEGKEVIVYDKFKHSYYNIKYKNSWKFISQNYF